MCDFFPFAFITEVS